MGTFQARRLLKRLAPDVVVSWLPVLRCLDLPALSFLVSLDLCWSLPEVGELVVAYEPVWAIGTGVTATPQDAATMHRAVRHRLAGAFGAEAAEGVPILYGGSVKPENAAELLSQPGVDGVLVGGASLDPNGFAAICRAAG